MITNDGKQIISRFLLGQVPAYATHLAIGCGQNPLSSIESVPSDLADKRMLDFEMLRVPITSKGFVNQQYTFSIITKALSSNTATVTLSESHNIVVGDSVSISGVDATFNGTFTVTGVGETTVQYIKTSGNVSPTAVSPVGQLIVSKVKISLTAELPTENRYAITEVGLWSAPNNSLASNSDSRMIFNFVESWQGHDSSIFTPPTISDLGAGNIDIVDNGYSVFYAYTDDPLFSTNDRLERKEGPRYLNKTLMLRGDSSSMAYTNIDDTWIPDGTHVHLNGVNFNISQNNAGDKLKLAFSLVDKLATGDSLPQSVRILLDFYKSEVDSANGWARAQIYIPGTYFTANRYAVETFTISQVEDPDNPTANASYPYVKFFTSPDFSSSSIRVCRLFSSVVMSDGSTSTDHYVAMDGFRIENTTENPVYKLSGYSPVRSEDNSSYGEPIVKYSNTNNYIDFRFNLGIE
jgi:hypothetical protein